MTTVSTQPEGAKPRKDDELFQVIAVMAIFLIALLCVDIWYSDWNGMTKTWASWGLVVGGIGHMLVVLSAIVALREWQDPNFDFFRRVCIVSTMLLIIFMCAFKAANNESKGVMDDSNKAKQEQAK